MLTDKRNDWSLVKAVLDDFMDEYGAAELLKMLIKYLKGE